MFHLQSLFYRKELAASSSRNSVAGDSVESSIESHVGRECGGPVMIHKKVLRQSSRPASTDNKLTKLLLNVNIQRSFGPVHVIISVENTVGDLIKAAIEVYLKENRRPLLTETDARCFDLHYSQFSLERLKPEEKLTNLESRNFFLCPKPNNINRNTASDASRTFCSNEANTIVAEIYADEFLFPYTRFMDFLL
ncbi:Histone deacetylase HDT [Heracleum sosnowskyi]|uniref:Histone deacetylase HDT n=1 Tax=Heracleum sosnowskyi TaxID=360622 RepID=A0AAD8IH13_9APIA|nr:Histone deacetylase HDT [Heracleum sosnowskyi]